MGELGEYMGDIFDDLAKSRRDNNDLMRIYHRKFLGNRLGNGPLHVPGDWANEIRQAVRSMVHREKQFCFWEKQWMS